MIMTVRIARLIAAWLLTMTAAAYAEQKASAYDVVNDTTKRVMAIVSQAQDYYERDPQRFYDEIEVILDEVVDFKSFAMGVMGRYASKQEYDQLSTAAEKRAYKARIERFSHTFRDALVRTYAKGLLVADSYRVEVLPTTDLSDSGSVTVTQKIYGNGDEPYTVLYKMRRDAYGQWKLRNVTIEAVNLGRVYQNQFASAAKQYNGNIDKVIDNWEVVPAGMESPNNHTS